MYNNGRVSVLTVDGNDVAYMLVRLGIALPDDASDSPFLGLYERAEADARADRLGAWASSEYASLVDTARSEAKIRSILDEKGLVITPSLRSGVVEPGAVLAFSTNVPAALSVAVGTGSFTPYDGPFIVDRDMEVRISAVSEVQTASGSPVLVNSFQSYHMLKNRYPTLYVSEAYPSPAKGEYEWVELFNPGLERVSLVGWVLDDAVDAGSKPVPFPPGSAIGPGERRVFSGSTIAWNNGGDEVRLLDPRGFVSHSVSYGSVKTGRAFAVTFAEAGKPLGHCGTFTPTPGAANRCAADPPKTRVASAAKGVKRAAPSMPVRYRNFVTDDGVPAIVRDVFTALRRSVENARSGRRFPNTLLFAGFIVLCASFVHWIDKIRQK